MTSNSETEYTKWPPRGRSITCTGRLLSSMARPIRPWLGVRPPSVKPEHNSIRSAPPSRAAVQSCSVSAQISRRDVLIWGPEQAWKPAVQILAHDNSVMPRRIALSAAFAIFLSTGLFAQQPVKWAVAVHGGAGSAEWEHMDAKSTAEYGAGLARALAAALAKLQVKGSAVDAVQAAIVQLEDDPQFNAGHGAAFNAEGKQEMDASIMDGSNVAAGSVAGVQFTKNPISLARAVMEHTPHVMLIGAGADALAR